jgi:hypothetical protein
VNEKRKKRGRRRKRKNGGLITEGGREKGRRVEEIGTE